MNSQAEPEQKLETLRKRALALAKFGTFAFSELNLGKILFEAALICADCLETSFSKICEYREQENHLRIVAGCGWRSGIVGYATSAADQSSPQGRAFATGEPQLCGNVAEANSYSLPSFYAEHGILSTVDVLVASKSGGSFGVLEVDSVSEDAFDRDDIDFLTAFANILAEAVATAERAEALRKTLVRMEHLVAEKEVLSQELKHRVRNNLHLVFGLLMAEVGAKHDPHSIFAFRSIALRVMGLAGVFDHLLGTGMGKTISFGDYVVTLCDNLPDLHVNEHVKLRCSAHSVELDLERATALGIVVTELVSNAYLHAFPERTGPERNGEIRVVLRATPGGASLSICDNGVGFVDEVESKRHGVGLVRLLVTQVGGTLSLRLDKGTTWTIDFAVAAAEPLLAA
jgi:two-component sensor histidine kinase